MRRHLNHVEIFLRDEVPLHPQSEFVTAWRGKDERGNIDAEVGDLQPVGDDDIGKGGTADQLFRVDVGEVDIKVIGAFRVREAEVESHLVMLKRKGDRL